MSKRPTGLESIERQLRTHDVRLKKLRAWRTAIVTAIGKCESEGAPRVKTLDTTPSLETLVYERDTLDREIRAHEILTGFGRDRQALELLDEVAGNATLAREAAPDPRAFAESRGVTLPRSMIVAVKVAADRVTVQIDYVDRSCVASLTFP